MSSSTVRVTNVPAIKNAPLVGLAEGNGSFNNYHLAALVLGVPYLLKSILPIVNRGGFKTYIFLVILTGVPTTIAYWTLNSMYGGRRNEKVHMPGKNIEEYITIKDAGLKSMYRGREKIPMQVFYDAYFEGKIDFNGDVLDVMEARLDWAKMNFTPELFKYVFTEFLPEVIVHSQSQDEEQVRGHYDRGDDFYSWFLGPRMIYTSGIILNPDIEESLEVLQDNKLAVVCNKLDLKPTDRLLDIGCGWGTLVAYAAKNFGCDTTGVTLGKNQAKFGEARIEKNGVSDRARILCCDYREIPAAKGTYTKIVSLEMAEHVGVRRYSNFLNQVYDMLDDDGVFVLQVAGIRPSWQYEDLIWGLFMNKYVFPGADASCSLGWVINKLEGAGFEIKNVDVLGVHYSATIHRWYMNWVSNKEKVVEKYGERWYRIWVFFLAYSTIISRQGSASVFQITMHKNLNAYHRVKGVTNHASIHVKLDKEPIPSHNIPSYALLVCVRQSESSPHVLVWGRILPLDQECTIILMHFSKTYSQILLTLPPELRENAIQYRQLKKLINQVVRELSTLGLSPAVLHELLEHAETRYGGPFTHNEIVQARNKQHLIQVKGDLQSPQAPTRIAYELSGNSDHLEPRLRLWVSTRPSDDNLDPTEDKRTDSDGDGPVDSTEGTALLEDLPRRRHSITTPSGTYGPQGAYIVADDGSHPTGVARVIDNTVTEEVVIPLVADTAFFQLLSSTLEALATHLTAVRSDFMEILERLSHTISATARPSSFSNSSMFRPYSGASSHAGLIRLPYVSLSKSDLYSWREVFQLYIEAEVFESITEEHAGERPVEDSEKRLKLFIERVTQRGLGTSRSMNLKQSHESLATFLELNLFILNIKKFQQANSEATRKILKKHAKRTALKIPVSIDPLPRTYGSLASLPRILVQAISEVLLPIIPHVDDYACSICTNIAFKPVRLGCGHLFCVRCLVKMQKRNQDNCPMCRAPNVLRANKTNVDWALLNFMQDWFPAESREKLRSNEREAAEEQLIEMGFNPNQPCILM
ncbi:hypothetical protein AX17_004125 [Amanita inopinata Kibby_2008]|nr:hypothetical protein AX17_004125 [Amanita inopinata Kibby_2008]